MSLRFEGEDVEWYNVKHFAQVQADDVSCSALALSINPVGWSQKVTEFVRHDFPLATPCWLLPSTMYKNILHYAQSKSIHVQFKSIAPCLVTKDLHKNFFSVFLLKILYILKGHNYVSLEPSLLQVEQPHPSLPFFIGEVLQAFEHFHSQKGANRILQKLLLLRFQLYLCLFLIFAFVWIISSAIY